MDKDNPIFNITKINKIIIWGITQVNHILTDDLKLFENMIWEIIVLNNLKSLWYKMVGSLISSQNLQEEFNEYKA
jgi:hypothetical protein